jgi:hypothetical protein
MTYSMQVAVTVPATALPHVAVAVVPETTIPQAELTVCDTEQLDPDATVIVQVDGVPAFKTQLPKLSD